MSLENRLAANVFASVLPWIDQDRPLFFMHDEGGQSANALPDLCFQFLGSQAGPIRIEFKVVKDSSRGRGVKLTANQVNGWCTSSSSSDKPHCWIGVHEGGEIYFFWEHAAIEPLIEQALPCNGYRTIRVPMPTLQCTHFLAVFRALLQFAEQRGLCP